MRKLIGFISLFVLLGLVSGKAEAAGATRGAKASVTISQNVNVVGISTGAAVAYGVILGTGTAGTDFVVLFDSASATGLVSGNQTSTTYKGRFNTSSTTVNTFITFDPPLQFSNGIMAVCSTNTMTATIIYERGRIVTGY